MDKKLVKFKPYTVNEIRQIFDLKSNGALNKEIASALGRTKASIDMFFTMERRTGKYSARLKNFEKGKASTKKVDIKINGVKVAEAPAAVIESQARTAPLTPMVQPKKDMSPREMIKRLYDLGYRIENNQLVCYVKQTVKIQDIINA